MTLNDLLVIEYEGNTYSTTLKNLLEDTFCMEDDMLMLEKTIQALIDYIDLQSSTFGETHILKSDFNTTYQKKINIQTAIDNPNYITEDKLNKAVEDVVSKSTADSEYESIEDKAKGIIAKAKDVCISDFAEC